MRHKFQNSTCLCSEDFHFGFCLFYLDVQNFLFLYGKGEGGGSLLAQAMM